MEAEEDKVTTTESNSERRGGAIDNKADVEEPITTIVEPFDESNVVNGRDLTPTSSSAIKPPSNDQDIMTPDVEPDSLSPHDTEVEAGSKMEDEIVQAFENEEEEGGEETDQGMKINQLRNI